MSRYVYQYTDAHNNNVSKFQFSETLIDCQLLHPLLNEDTSVAERTLAQFILATTVSNEIQSNPIQSIHPCPSVLTRRDERTLT